ncbi:MAG: S-methyl-5-thioribose-1-phosphate isomerase [Pirellulaceae bacterium]|nr:S-methyl-5-thioribose-1-phosphate isomerase [Pirellulaceae bacterium]
MTVPNNPVYAIEWHENWNGTLRLLDQTKLPESLEVLDCQSVETVWEAIVMLRVRGAPAIGIAAAYGVLLSLRKFSGVEPDSPEIRTAVHQAIDYLATSRPTAVNLFWALERMRRRLDSESILETVSELGGRLLDEARRIHDEDRIMCHAIGKFGASLIHDGMGLLTHCNTGGLATSEYGTALSAFFTAQDQGKSIHVYADETRPLLQGSRLTAWELMQRKIDCTVICDSMAAQVMREGKVQAVFVGADRITARGDAANKIGTYGVAVLAKYHGIPFYVAAPSSTFDLSIVDGDEIPIEQRRDIEITHAFGKRTAPVNARVYNPAFDVTPAELITAIITERGIIQPVTQGDIQAMLS